MDWEGLPLRVETGKMGRQADGAALVSWGDTIVLATTVFAKESSKGIDFLPLSVHYQEKTFAAGRIPGGFFKREGRPSEEEILTSRLIDRPIRPLFPKDFHNEIQIIATVLSLGEGDRDIAAMIAASASLSLSSLPFHGPVGCARVVMDEAGAYSVGGDRSSLDLVVAGTKDSVLMVESRAGELSEEQMLKAILFGHEKMQPVISLIEKLAKKVGKPAFLREEKEEHSWLKKHSFKDYIEELLKIGGREDRKAKLKESKEKMLGMLAEDENDRAPVLFGALEDEYHKALRKRIVGEGVRPDHRGPADIRPIECEVGLLPSTHGSSLFTRGETQALVVTTLGTGEDEQIIDSLEGHRKENFMLHYNFPAYSVGEINNRMGVSRREVGHGKLAKRAIQEVLPESGFPYTIRLVSEILESNGSSSMATVCGSSMALMDAGVPIKSAVAGIAMGLIKEGEKFKILSDIAGEEDHCGDMDFKVAGTKKGVIALQMDIKIDGVSEEILHQALVQAKSGRLHILQEMEKAISSPRSSLRDTAPRMASIQVSKGKIKDVIGSGGKVIREICETTGAKVDISEDGLCNVSAVSEDSLNNAVKRIRGIVDDPEVGEIYKGKVVKIMEFGAFVNFFGQKDGLVHISQITESRVDKVEDFLTEGKEVYVKVLGLDKGKVRLSMRGVNQRQG